MFKTVFEVECPGCGTQRALLSAERRDLECLVSLGSVAVFVAVFVAVLFLATGKLLGVKKISGNMVKNAGFACLLMILISYLSKLIIK